ncbi:hypothetical protein SSPIM334S_08027 [Streptomyces spiroverticillatus]
MRPRSPSGCRTPGCRRRPAGSPRTSRPHRPAAPRPRLPRRRPCGGRPTTHPAPPAALGPASSPGRRRRGRARERNPAVRRRVPVRPGRRAAARRRSSARSHRQEVAPHRTPAESVDRSPAPGVRRARRGRSPAGARTCRRRRRRAGGRPPGHRGAAPGPCSSAVPVRVRADRSARVRAAVPRRSRSAWTTWTYGGTGSRPRLPRTASHPAPTRRKRAPAPGPGRARAPSSRGSRPVRRCG